MTRPRRRGNPRKGKPPQKASKSPEKEAETPGSTSSKRSTRKSRLTGEQVELIERLTVVALSAVEPAVKLIETLMRLR